MAGIKVPVILVFRLPYFFLNCLYFHAVLVEFFFSISLINWRFEWKSYNFQILFLVSGSLPGLKNNYFDRQPFPFRRCHNDADFNLSQPVSAGEFVMKPLLQVVTDSFMTCLSYLYCFHLYLTQKKSPRLFLIQLPCSLLLTVRGCWTYTVWGSAVPALYFWNNGSADFPDTDLVSSCQQIHHLS